MLSPSGAQSPCRAEGSQAADRLLFSWALPARKTEWPAWQRPLAEDTVVRIDMSEYMERHVSLLDRFASWLWAMMRVANSPNKCGESPTHRAV